ncbi:monovalent cation/H(+) antiporter subunit G [Cellulomonas sp. IC4_254]|uniref:cation:proton antiporter n=1 Tax=Cellulomonas sp. IC4_254 TaxID=2714040 RepID=UPI0014242BDC|nr:monovalent cation/H(+) antiporter subunit G [Cellulomonas sp. IC4_254]NHT17288.1 Na+/H+ antiporter subunit G [Cellulomonas sp. IC4_254]
MLLDALTVVLVTAGCLFVTAGTVGLLRFPDLSQRLHALTKADTLGLGLVVLGLVVQGPGWAVAAKLGLLWLLALLASATNGALLARGAAPPPGTGSGP